MELILRQNKLRSSLCLLIVLVVGAFLLCSSSAGQDGLELFHKMHKWLADRDSRFKITSSMPNVIRIADGSDLTHQMEITVDPVTALPRTETTTSLADPAHPAKSEVRIEEWLSVDGIRFPRRTVTYRNGARVAEMLTERYCSATPILLTQA